MTKKGYIYLLCDNKNDSFKIGKTKKSIEKRIKELQTGNSNELFIVNYHETNYPSLVENMLHKHFSEKQILNEWYQLSDEDVAKFLNICDKIEDNIKILSNNPFFKKMLK